MTTMEMLKNWNAWYLFSLTFFMFIFTFYLVNTYKEIAMNYINDDYFLATIGALSFAIGTFGRFFYGRMLDLYPWKLVMGSTIAVQIICTLIMEFSFINNYFFAAIFIIASFGGTAMFTGAMIITDKFFPEDRWIFSYTILGLVLNMIVIYIVRGYFTPAAGEAFTFFLMAGLEIIALLHVLLQPDTKDYEKLS